MSKEMPAMCEDTIQMIAEEFRSVPPKERGAKVSECEDRIVELPWECDESIVAAARQILTRPPDEEQTFLLILLFAMARRNPALCARLCDEAVRSPRGDNKETYVELLDDLEVHEANAALLWAASQKRLHGDMEGEIRHKAVAAVRRRRLPEAIPLFASLLVSRRENLKEEAARYFADTDALEVVDLLVERLGQEKNIRVLRYLITAISRRKAGEGIAALRRLATQKSIEKDVQMSKLVERAITELEAATK